MGDEKRITRDLLVGVGAATFFAAVGAGINLIRHGEVGASDIEFWIMPVAGFAGGFIGNRWGGEHRKSSTPK